MREVYMKHNPYRSTTEVLIDREQPEQNSWFNGLEEKRLQDWVEALPQRLAEECNEDVEVTFHGTAMDYADVEEVCMRAAENGCRIKITTKFQRGKETQDKEAELQKLYQEIQRGPNEALREDEKIKRAFTAAQENICEVAVVAPMSAGKSTLLNSLLGEDLLPVSGGACTAILTEIHDEEGKAGWTLSAYDEDGNILVKNQENATGKDVKNHNGESEKTSKVVLRGKIPFVSSREIRLKLVDTPGPDSTTHPEHERVQNDYLEKANALILFVLPQTYENKANDDVLKALMKIGDKMNDKEGGKKSSDRFIFVLTCMDATKKKNDGELAEILQKVENYLEGAGIKHPQIFPVSAKAALDIRRYRAGKADSEEEADAKTAVEKFNPPENGKHLEKGASLPQNLRDEISTRLQEAQQAENQWEEALIHTGIPSLELAIDQYVRKYAKVENIKRIAKRMSAALDDSEAESQLNQAVLESEEELEKKLADYGKIEAELQDGEAAKEFARRIESSSDKVKEEAEEKILKILRKYQGHLTEEYEKYQSLGEVSVGKAKKSAKEMKRVAKDVEDVFIPKLKEYTEETLRKHAGSIYAEYRERLNRLAETVTTVSVEEKLNPLHLIQGGVGEMKGILEDAIYEREVPDGGHYEANERFVLENILQPWKFLFPGEHYVQDYKMKRFVDMRQFAQEFFAVIEESLRANREAVKKYIEQQTKHIIAVFQQEAAGLENILRGQREKMERYKEDSVYAREQLEAAKRNLQWLVEIKTKMDAVLDI